MATAKVSSEYTEEQLKEFRENGVKFDPIKGLYLPFPGLSVVCNLTDTSTTCLLHLPEVLSRSPTLGSWFLPLPASSYHVTVLDIYCKYAPLHEDAKWEALLKEPRWEAAADELAGANLLPRLRIKKVHTLSRCVLAAELEPADEATPDHPAKQPINQRLVDVMRLEKNQPHPWHMTLGYVTKPDELDEGSVDYMKDLAAFDEAVRGAVGPELGLDVARLCRFPDMQAFIPWDGRAP